MSVSVFYLPSSQEGLLRVLLDGGPLRVFAESDAAMLEDDLQQLKVCHL